MSTTPFQTAISQSLRQNVTRSTFRYMTTKLPTRNATRYSSSSNSNSNNNSRIKTPNPLPATYLRGGTSKGIFIQRKHLPEDTSQWERIFQGIMGSPDPKYKRQLNGIGGGISSLSKIVIVGPPSEKSKGNDVDCEYLFVQVGVEDGAIDTAGNCGNLSAMVGVFAVDEGIVTPRKASGSNGGETIVKSWNLNTSKVINTTFPSDSKTGHAVLDLPHVEMDGVPGEASPITLNFVNPGGARTGKLLPTGRIVDVLELPNEEQDLVEVSLVDASNPTVILPHHELRILLSLPPATEEIDYTEKSTLYMLELVRREGAKAMGLDPDVQSQPKIVVVRPPREGSNVDVEAKALSMGVLHKAIPMTVGLCVGVAGSLKGSVVHRILVQAAAKEGKSSVEKKSGIVLGHPSGKVTVGAEFGEDGKLKAASVVRTGRRLMKGHVWW